MFVIRVRLLFRSLLVSLWIVEHPVTGEIARSGSGVQIQSAFVVRAHNVLVEVDQMGIVDACSALDSMSGMASGAGRTLQHHVPVMLVEYHICRGRLAKQ